MNNAELDAEIAEIEKQYEALMGAARLPAVIVQVGRPLASLTPRVVQSFTTYGAYEKPI